MTITTTPKGIRITLGAHTKKDIQAAAKKAEDLWSVGKWAEVQTILGDPIFWITPNGAKCWDM
jgi:hypothetical protein